MNLTIAPLATILFEITLFLIFVYYLRFVIKAYVAPPLQEKMKHDAKDLSELETEKKLLIMQHDIINDHIARQRQHLEQLEEKMKVWHAALIKKDQAVERSIRSLQKHLAHKKEIQANHFTAEILQETIIPEAVKQARAQLREASGGDRGADVLESIVDQL